MSELHTGKDADFPLRQSGLRIATLLILLLTCVVGYVVMRTFIPTQRILFSMPSPHPQTSSKPQQTVTIEPFSSAEDFKEYLQRSSQLQQTFYSQITGFSVSKDVGPLSRNELAMPQSAGGIERSSATNVQVSGIDEPDIIKTADGKMYISTDQPYFITPQQLQADKILSPNYRNIPNTKIVSAFPPSSMEVGSQIDAFGNLLLSKNTLIVLGATQISAYDVSIPAQPKQSWSYRLGDNNQLLTARMYENTLYVATQEYIDHNKPCPRMPLLSDQRSVTITCTNILHPSVDTPVDTTYTLLQINPQNGDVASFVSFVGSANSTVVYMSSEYVYVTYTYQRSMFGYLANFYTQQNAGFLPQTVYDKIVQLRTLTISEQAKLVELQSIIGSYQATLMDDEQLKFQTEFTNRLQMYGEKHQRELEQSGIVRASLRDFGKRLISSVPGSILNQFALDEHEHFLRIATTTSSNISESRSANDVYVLDDQLQTVGMIQDLGLGERIYSARFVGDRGYLVTFRQTDPFYVLDMSNPHNPRRVGELKIPGFSSYLHPLTSTEILGVGKDATQLKLSLFDVSKADTPREIDKYILQDYHSEVLNTQHAFLQDSKHEIFFLPGSQGSYIFSYKGGKLNLLKALASEQLNRAIFINDYLYVVGNNKIVVLDENKWQQVGQLSL